MLLFDYESALDRFMGEKDILIEVLPPYLESLNDSLKDLKSLKSGNDCKKLREVAHSIKGSSLNLDIIPLGREAEILEDMAYNNISDGISDVIDRIIEIAARTESELKKYIV